MALDLPTSHHQTLLTLLNLRGIGYVSAIRPVNSFKSRGEIFEASLGQLQALIPLRRQANFFDPTQPWLASAAASRLLELTDQLSVSLIPFFERLRAVVSSKFPLILDGLERVSGCATYEQLRLDEGAAVV